MVAAKRRQPSRGRPLAADRWAPWIEPYTPCTGGTVVVNSTTPSILAPQLLFTPHLNVRVAAAVNVDAECTTASATSVLVVDMLVDGTPIAPQLLMQCNTALERLILSRTFQFDLTGAGGIFPHTIQLRARLNVAGASFNVYCSPTGVHTGLGPLIVMPNLTPP